MDTVALEELHAETVFVEQIGKPVSAVSALVDVVSLLRVDCLRPVLIVSRIAFETASGRNKYVVFAVHAGDVGEYTSPEQFAVHIYVKSSAVHAHDYVHPALQREVFDRTVSTACSPSCCSILWGGVALHPDGKIVCFAVHVDKWTRATWGPVGGGRAGHNVFVLTIPVVPILDVEPH